jgi:hypothetical protein
MSKKFYFTKEIALQKRKQGQRVVRRKLKNGRSIFILRRSRKSLTRKNTNKFKRFRKQWTKQT